MDGLKVYLFIACFMVTEIWAFTQLKNCGTSSVSTLGDRIVGGREAVPNEFPWQVSLRYKLFLMSPMHLCGATVLNEYWVLTAAHCVHKRSKLNLKLAAGLHSQKEKNVTSLSVDKVIIHDNFVRDTLFNDIALIKLKKPLVINDKVNSICLPDPGENATGIAVATGWGNTYEDGDGSDVLNAVDLPIAPDVICEDIFGTFFSKSIMMCAGLPEGGKDTCQGDSGGPLVQRRNGTFVLVGIVSFGFGCARPLSPGIYTKVSSFVKWINDNVY